MNALAVLLCIADKIKAARGLWRISEKTLFAVSLIGGAAGMLLCMKTIRHKTCHKRFMIGLPIIIVLQIMVFVFLYLYC